MKKPKLFVGPIEGGYADHGVKLTADCTECQALERVGNCPKLILAALVLAPFWWLIFLWLLRGILQ